MEDRQVVGLQRDIRAEIARRRVMGCVVKLVKVHRLIRGKVARQPAQHGEYKQRKLNNETSVTAKRRKRKITYRHVGQRAEGNRDRGTLKQRARDYDDDENR